MGFESKYIDNIISANNDNSLAIFVGAGISKSSETDSFKLPNWNDLIVDLKKELDDIDESDYLKIAQLYYLAFGEYSYYQKLKKYFPDFIAPSEIHKLIFELNPHVILTTNWDNILERTIEDNAYIFDVICSDIDLVKSSLQNKLIKMHGDFKNHNIVFKEDDYINYQFNFPLIENYVKSILSTHTILFIGYSYNDVNLKQILNWIKNHSDARPPIYITTFKNNQTQVRYLENHGITSIHLTEEADSAIGYDSYSKKMFTFLEKIKTQNEQCILHSDNEIISFILKKLEPLNDLNNILVDQIQKVLTNCRFLFDDDLHSILVFCKTEVTTNHDQNKRDIYNKFTEIIKNLDKNPPITNQNIIKIFNILYKAGIKGIAIPPDNEEKNITRYVVLSEHIATPNAIVQNSYDFSYNIKESKNNDIKELFNLAFSYYNLGQFKEAFHVLEEAVTYCLKKRNYTLLFIAMFNRNIVLDSLRYSFTKENKQYKAIPAYDLKERYYNLPKNLRVALEPIYKFIDFSAIYKYFYEINEQLKEIESSKQTIELGGFVFNSNPSQHATKHVNMVNFILENKIFVEKFTEYKNINKASIQIAILRQVQREYISLNKVEIYSCIKFLEYKELKLLLNEPLKENGRKFQLTSDDKQWLITVVIPNIVREYVAHQNSVNPFHNYLKNALFLISLSELSELSEPETHNIIDVIKSIILNEENTIDIYETINDFLAIQHHLYNVQIEKEILIEIIEGLINKIIYKKYNGYFYHALSNNKFSNVYGHAEKSNVSLSNDKLVTKLLNEISDSPVNEQINFFHNFLLNIHPISNKKIQNKIKKLALSLDITSFPEIFTKIYFNLSLAIYKFKPLEDSTIDQIEEYLDEYRDGRKFSSNIYLLNQQIKYLIRKKTLDSKLQHISKILDSIIEMDKQRQHISIF